jgi:ATP-binding cassette, subfamily B, bacterial
VALRERHAALARAVTSGTTRAAALGGLLGAAGRLIFAAGFVAGIAVVAVRAAHGTASVGQVVLAVTLIQRAQVQVGQAAAAFGQLLTTARTARRMPWLEDYAAADRAAALAAGQAPAPEVLTSGLTLREVSFGYPPDGPLVLDRIDLHLPAGSAVALAGENGAGKTTLVKLLTGMYRPNSGEVRRAHRGGPVRALPGRAQAGPPDRRDHGAGLAPVLDGADGRPDRGAGPGPDRGQRRP